jgi:MFS family permease
MVGLACIAFCPEPVRAARTGPPVTLDRLWKTATAPALIGVSLLSAVQNYATFSTVFGFTPVYAERLGATRADLGTLTAVSLIPFALAQPITAWLNRRYGPRNVVVIGLAMIGLTAVTTPLCETLPILLAVQVVAGGARGVVGTTLMGMAIRRVSQSERATAMGVYQAVYAIGMFSGPLIGGLVGEVSGLPMIFISTGAVALVASVVAIRVLRDA